ncbi:unnamed protein product, partial [Arctia plantaginis]
MRDLEKALEEQKKENLERVTPLSYAEAVASYGTDTSRTPGKRTVHSIIVTSKEDTETGDEVLTRVRKAVDAKEGWRKKLATNEVLIEAGKRRVAIALLQEPYVGAAKEMRSHQGVRIFQNANHGEVCYNLPTNVPIVPSSLRQGKSVRHLNSKFNSKFLLHIFRRILRIRLSDCE